jgi:hypothetical protein
LSAQAVRGLAKKVRWLKQPERVLRRLDTEALMGKLHESGWNGTNGYVS